VILWNETEKQPPPRRTPVLCAYRDGGDGFYFTTLLFDVEDEDDMPREVWYDEATETEQDFAPDWWASINPPHC
jgi:hypothetical protein